MVVLWAGAVLAGAAPDLRKAKRGGAPEYMPGVVVVKLKAPARGSGGSSAPVLSKSASGAAIASVMQRYAPLAARQPFAARSTPLGPGEEEFARVFEVKVPSTTDIPALVRELEERADVEYAEPKYARKTHYIPNDSLYSSLWHFGAINAPQAWDVTKGDAHVVIGIVDSGTDYTHPDLAANIWTNPGETGTDASGRSKTSNGVDDDANGYIDDWRGWDFVGATLFAFAEDNDPHPYNGNTHGTHTAGIASAVTDNRTGIAGMGFGTRLMITKHGIDTPGDDNIYFGDDGILYCINNGATIVSCSWGGSGGSRYEQDIVKYGLSKNVLIAASAGNGGDDLLGDDIAEYPEYPGAFPGVLSVGATDSQNRITYFSNYGAAPQFKVFAPGLNILSTVPNKAYKFESGTSMSTPMAAGLAALVKAAHPSWTASQLMFQLCGTSDNIDAQNINLVGRLGFGRINALRAVTEVASDPGPDIAFVSVSVDDTQGGNGNNTLDPGEQAKVLVTIENRWGDAANVTATLTTTSWAATVTKANSSYGSLRGIALVDSATKTNTSDPFTLAVSPQAIPTNIPLTILVTASNSAQKEFSFTLPVQPSVLVVDDDDGELNVEGYYTSALQSLGIVYEQWDHSAKGTPPVELMLRYKTAIWFTEWNVPTLDSADRVVLAAYLDSGRKLFLSGQENGWDLCGSDGPENMSSAGASKTFYEKYLKGTFIADDAGTFLIKGVAGDEIGDALAFTRDQPGRGTGQNPDVIVPTGGAAPIFTYAKGTYATGANAAGVKFKGAYSLVSLSFGGYESITDSAQRLMVMDRVLRYLGGYTVTVAQLPDHPPQPYTVTATVTTADASPSVELLWTVDGVLPYRRVTMTKTGGTASTGAGYSGVIAPSPGTLIEYFVLVKTADGFLPYTVHRFAVNIPTGATPEESRMPHEFSLSQNYPNPFNPSTLIRYSVGEAGPVRLAVFDALGREVCVLVDGVLTPGAYTAQWNAPGLPSGVYFCRLSAGPRTSIKKLTLLR